MTGTIISSSVLIIAIFLLRPLIRRRVSPTAVYSLWALVVIRLLCPLIYPFTEVVGMVKSRLSVMNAVELFQREVIEGSVMEPLADNLASGRVYGYGEPVHIAMKAAGIDWQLWIMVVWVLGSVLIAVWMITANLRFMRRLQAERRPYAETVPEYVTKHVYVVPGLSSPCYFGLGRDEGIYLPEGIAGDEKATIHALAHEMGHVRHGDRLWGILRCMLLCYYWVNPFVWLGAVLSRRDCELACDEAAVKLLGEEERYAYGRTLVGLIAGQGGGNGLFLASTTMTAGKRTIKERIQTLARHPQTRVSMAVVLAGIVVILGACTFTEKSEVASVEAPLESGSTAEETPREEKEAGKDVLVLSEDRQQGNYCEILLERRDGESGEPKPVFTDDFSADNVIDVTAYKDAKGQEPYGNGHPEQGWGFSVEKERMTVRIWNRELAGSFQITVNDAGTELEYFYVPKAVEPISEYTLASKVRNVSGLGGTSVWLKSVEEFPGSLGIVLRGESQDAVMEFYDNNDIYLKPVGADSYHDYIAPRSSGRDGMEIFLLYLLPGDIPPLSQVEAFAVGRGTSQEDYVETVLDEYQIAMTAKQFVAAYLSGDAQTAAAYSEMPAEALRCEVKELSPGAGTLTTGWNPMDKETYAEGTYAFHEEGQEDSITYLYLTMKKARGEWAVVDLWFEK